MKSDVHVLKLLLFKRLRLPGPPVLRRTLSSVNSVIMMKMMSQIPPDLSKSFSKKGKSNDR